jgi:mono/diheme cytochrome c family protein
MVRVRTVHSIAVAALVSCVLACSRHDPAATAPANGESGTPAHADVTRGRVLFAAQCAACHGATGAEGGVGPSLVNEKKRQDRAQTIAWIENPQPPMPKLYPAPLSGADVEQLADYVQSL